MCGIAGVFRYRESGRKIDPDVGQRMLDAIVHRGPDDGGLLVGNNVLLGHRRLSILDLSQGGHQPMSDASRRYWLVFNGEIYNYRELRKELEASGHHFVSQTDTEVILRGYLQWGQQVSHRLNGMFAFAIYEADAESIWLVRDPIGIKPLFYRDDGSRIQFGSEIKAILADPSVPREPDRQALDHFLTFGYTPAPETGFAGVRQLMPGESLSVRKGEPPSLQSWFALPYPDESVPCSLGEATARLESVIDDAVVRQMTSDVPLGAFLSGGLDSSAVIRSMCLRSDRPPATFTIGFDEPSFDESSYANEVSRIFNTRHHEQKLAASAHELLDTVVSHAEEPFADNSAIAMFLLCQFARQHVTVALSGDGADELLAGYATYRASRLAPWFRTLPRQIRSMISHGVQMLPRSNQKYAMSAMLQRFVDGAGRPFPMDHCSWRRYLSESTRQQLYTPAMYDRLHREPLAPYAAALNDAPPQLSSLEKQLHMDLRFHLPNDMLTKVDRMSMAHGMEVRVPLLDLEVVRVCLAIPECWKRQGKRGKIALRHAMRRDLPKAILNRRKSGFLVPLERWLAGPWQSVIADVLTEDFANASEMFDWKPLRQMIDENSAGRSDYSYPLYALLILGVWWRTWISQTRSPQLVRPQNAAPNVVHHLEEKR